MNRMNFNPNIWGKNAWLFIETSILSYPDNPDNDIKKGYYNFLESLLYIIPCYECRRHYRDFFNNNKLTDDILSSRDKLIDWIINCHNNVNKINGKPLISNTDFINYYNNLYKKSCNKCVKKQFNYKLLFNIIIILIFCLIIYFYK